MAPAKNNRQEKKMTRTTRNSAAVGNRRLIGFASFSNFGRFAAMRARRKNVKEQGSKRGRAGMAGGRMHERARLDASVLDLDASMLRPRRRGEDVVYKQDGVITGRLGEAAVHKYFVEKLGSGSSVNWMNKYKESGLPYDITITKGEVTEYVEVKATTIPNKSWFHITRRQLQFATKKRDLLTIAYVLLSKLDKASIVLLKNPHKLLRQRDLKLASIVFLKSLQELIRRQGDMKPALVMSTRCEQLVGEFMEQISVVQPDCK